MANENPTWGDTRIRGGLKHLGHEVARNTIKAILKDHGIRAGGRAAHGDAVEDVPRRALGRHRRSRLLYRGSADDARPRSLRRVLRDEAEDPARGDCRITHQPDEAWMAQIARSLTAAGEGFLYGMHHVILDRNPMYTTAFRRLLRDCGVRPLVLPARSPNLNAFAERFVESIKCECLNRIVPLGKAHLRTAVQEFVHHYHTERPHQGLGNEFIGPHTTVIETGQTMCRERLGGLLKFYYREAAYPHWSSFRTGRDGATPHNVGLLRPEIAMLVLSGARIVLDVRRRRSENAARHWNEPRLSPANVRACAANLRHRLG